MTTDEAFSHLATRSTAAEQYRRAAVPFLPRPERPMLYGALATPLAVAVTSGDIARIPATISAPRARKAKSDICMAVSRSTARYATVPAYPDSIAGPSAAM